MKTLLATLAAAFVATAALAGTATAAPVQRAAMNDTIVGVAAGDARFSTLVALVKQAGLVKTLSGKGPFTVFAPTNAAFAKLKKTAPATYTAVTKDKALLTSVLTYHVLAGKVGSTAAIAVAKKNGSVKSVQGEKNQAVAQGRQALPERQLAGDRRKRRRVERRHPRDQHRDRPTERRLAATAGARRGGGTTSAAPPGQDRAPAPRRRYGSSRGGRPNRGEHAVGAEEERHLGDAAVLDLQHLKRPRVVAAVGSRLVLPSTRASRSR